MQINDIIALITLGFPFISVIMAVFGAIYIMRYRGDIYPLVARLMDSREFLDAITSYVVNNIVVEKKNDYYIIRVRNDFDVSIAPETQ